MVLPRQPVGRVRVDVDKARKNRKAAPVDLDRIGVIGRPGRADRGDGFPFDRQVGIAPIDMGLNRLAEEAGCHGGRGARKSASHRSAPSASASAAAPKAYSSTLPHGTLAFAAVVIAVVQRWSDIRQQGGEPRLVLDQRPGADGVPRTKCPPAPETGGGELGVASSAADFRKPGRPFIFGTGAAGDRLRPTRASDGVPLCLLDIPLGEDRTSRRALPPK